MVTACHQCVCVVVTWWAETTLQLLAPSLRSTKVHRPETAAIPPALTTASKHSRACELTHSHWASSVNQSAALAAYSNVYQHHDLTTLVGTEHAMQGLKTLFVSTRTSCSELRTSCSRRKDKRILWSFRTMTWTLPRLRAVAAGRGRWGSPPPPQSESGLWMVFLITSFPDL